MIKTKGTFSKLKQFNSKKPTTKLKSPQGYQVQPTSPPPSPSFTRLHQIDGATTGYCNSKNGPRTSTARRTKKQARKKSHIPSPTDHTEQVFFRLFISLRPSSSVAPSLGNPLNPCSPHATSLHPTLIRMKTDAARRDMRGNFRRN
jgi:hypothetical protein